MTEETITDPVPVSRRRRRTATGGFTLKLDAPQRPGYVRRWVNNSPARIAEMHELGYDFVQDKAADGAKRTQGQGTRISRHAGKDKEGKAVQAVLMETPADQYAIGRAEMEADLQKIDDAIARGEDTRGQLADAYKTSDRSSITHNADP